MAISRLHRPLSAPTTFHSVLSALSSAGERREDQINRVKLRIATFERMHKMRSDEMIAKMDSGELQETDDICLWRMDVDLLRHVTSA